LTLIINYGIFADMKKDTHPKYFAAAKITCSCGNTFTTGSTLEAIQIEVCSNCHPFYTGKQKFIDTARRVEKFQERTNKTEAAKAKRGTTPSKKAKRKVKDSKKSAKAALKQATEQ